MQLINFGVNEGNSSEEMNPNFVKLFQCIASSCHRVISFISLMKLPCLGHVYPCIAFAYQQFGNKGGNVEVEIIAEETSTDVNALECANYPRQAPVHLNL